MHSTVAYQSMQRGKLYIPITSANAQVTPRDLLKARIHFLEDPGAFALQFGGIRPGVPSMLVYIHYVQAVLSAWCWNARVEHSA